MNETAKFEYGSKVFCGDTPCGTLLLAVVHPATGKLAHLIVQPDNGRNPRLVAAAMASATDEGVRVACTPEEFDELEPAVRAHFIPGSETERRWVHRPDDTPPPAPDLVPHVKYEDRVPANETRIRRGEHVHAADGDVGHVRGLLVDPGDDTVTHILLDEGHLWTRKHVAVPMQAITSISRQGVTVRLTREQVRHLPPFEAVG